MRVLMEFLRREEESGADMGLAPLARRALAEGLELGSRSQSAIAQKIRHMVVYEDELDSREGEEDWEMEEEVCGLCLVRSGVRVYLTSEGCPRCTLPYSSAIARDWKRGG